MLNRRLERLFFVSMFTLVVVFFYSTNGVALADEGITWAAGYDDDTTFASGILEGGCNNGQGNSGSGKPWKTFGNDKIDSNKHFIGTTNEADLIFKTFDSESMRISFDGDISIGTDTATQKLEVNGCVKADCFIGDGSLLTGIPGTGPETDPVFGASPAVNITAPQIADWNTAFSWGDHSTAGYLTSFFETDPFFSAWDKSTGIVITESQVSNLNHFNTSNETDPTVQSNVKDGVDWSELSGIPAGIIQLEVITSAPLSTDCDEASEEGRMKFDATNDLLYICSGVSGWVSK